MTDEAAIDVAPQSEAAPDAGGGKHLAADRSNGNGTETPEEALTKGPLVALRHLIVGFCMGSAEVVPGVSGGTVALIGGIYTRLIDAVRDAANVGLAAGRARVAAAIAGVRRLDWWLLAPLGVGQVVAVLTLARVVEHYLDTQPVRLAGLFLGMVLGSALIAVKLIRKLDAAAVALILAVGAGLFLLLGLRQETGAESGDATAPLWAYPLAASIAICAWILPGLSGSLMLVMMGMYSHVFGALNDRDLGPILLFAVGGVLGLAAFSKLLSWLLEHHHDRMMAVMIGLMLGSLRVLWPWPGGVDSTSLGAPGGNDVVLPVVLCVVGLTAILAFGWLGGLSEKQEGQEGRA